MEKLLHGQVIQIEQDERSRNYRWERNAGFLDQNIQVVSIDDYNEYIKDGEQNLPQIVNIGTVLVKHPFEEDTYIHLEELEQIVYRSKALHMADIAQLLGCTRFSYDIKIDSIETASIGRYGKISYTPYITADTKYKNEQVEKYKAMLKIEDKNEVNDESQNLTLEDKILSYKRACELAHKYKLDKDEDIKSLLDSRNPYNTYIKKSRIVCFELSREVNSLYSCAFSLELLKGVFTMQGNFENQVSKKKTIFVTFSFDF